MPPTVVFHVPPRDLAEDCETCQTLANGCRSVNEPFLFQGSSRNVWTITLKQSKKSQTTAPHTTPCPKTKNNLQNINMGSDIIGILDLHAKHIIFFIQQCLVPWHGLLWESATRKHAQALQSVCKWCWLAGIVTTWNPDDPYDWFRAFLWRVGAPKNQQVPGIYLVATNLLFRNQDLGYISSTWFSWNEENFLSYSLPFWGDVGVSKSGALNPIAVNLKRRRTISKWFRKFSQFAKRKIGHKST